MSSILQSDTAKLLTRRRAVTFACMMAIFMSAVEATIVATAMPTIVGQLGAFHLFSWVFAAYLLAQAVSTPIYGRLADLYGRKQMFISGSAIFLLASTACGFTWAFGEWGMASLVLFRTIQGFGAGSLQSMATTIVGDIYPPTDRARVQGWLSGVWGLAALAGPVLGAFIVQHVHWAFVFWINLPIGIVAILVMASSLRERIELRSHHVDVVGSVLLMVGVGGVLMTVVQAQNLGVPLAASLFGVGVLALLLLILQERHAKEPIVPFQLWRQRIVAECSAGGLTIGALLMFVVAFLPTYVQAAMGRSVTFGGTALAILSVSWSISAIVAARLMGLSSYRTVGLIGSAMLISGTALLITLDRDAAFLRLGAATLLVGFGMGFCNQTFLLSMQGSVHWNQRGVATSSFLFARTIGQTIGAAIGGAMLNFGVARQVPGAGDALERLLDPGRRDELGTDTIARLGSAIADALHEVYIVAGVLAVATLVIVLLLPARLSYAPQAPDQSGTKTGK
jgi:EmrB/QacA subfamily drug resistance transporter